MFGRDHMLERIGTADHQEGVSVVFRGLDVAEGIGDGGDRRRPS